MARLNAILAGTTAICLAAAAGCGQDAAMAADVPVVHKAPAALLPSWTGFYAGVGVGTRSSKTDANVTEVFDNGVPQVAFICAALAASGGCVTGEPMNDTALRFSPYFGFNWQFAPKWVAGVEADVGLANKTTTLDAMRYPYGQLFTGNANEYFSVKTGWDAGARARLGYLVDPSLMVYATAGAAWLHVETTATCNPVVNGACSPPATSGPLVIANATTRLGWTIGGGIEAMLTANWILRGEYRYADFGTASFSDTRFLIGGAAPQTVNYDLDIKTHTATLGLAYKFGSDRYPVAGASAAVAAAPSWQGIYAGLGGGTRSTEADAKLTAMTFGGVDTLTGLCSFSTATGGCPNAKPLNDTAFRASPYVGFNWHAAPRLIVGVEADAGFADRTTRLAGMNYPLNSIFVSRDADSFSVRAAWDASLRGRLGVLATPALLVYATAGAAWMHVETTSTCSTGVNSMCSGVNTAGPISISHATTRFGWTAGAGLEHQFWSHWMARAEYRYADFGTITNHDVRTGGQGLTATYDVAIKSHTTTLGVAYKF